MPEKQIKSRQRVADHGEVFTSEREVKAMCDLVEQECDRIDSRFLEPACGDGNFLAEVLARKLAIVKKRYGKNPFDYERYSLLAVSSIYGVELLQDNVDTCIERLFKQWETDYKATCKSLCNDQTKESVRYILSKNILCGNALTMMCVDDNQQDTNMPIIFPEWSLVTSAMFKRRDFRLDVLLKANEKPENSRQLNWIEDEDSIYNYLDRNPVTGEYMPKPLREFEPIHYRRLKENG